MRSFTQPEISSPKKVFQEETFVPVSMTIRKHMNSFHHVDALCYNFQSRFL